MLILAVLAELAVNIASSVIKCSVYSDIWVPDVLKSLRSGLLVGEGNFDVVLDWIVRVLNDLGLLILGPLWFVASNAWSTNWVGHILLVELDISNNPLVLEGSLSIGEMLGSGDHVSVKGWSEVVIGVLGLVVPFGLWLLGSKVPVVVDHDGGEFLVFEGGDHVWISTIVWHWVVDWVSKLCLFVLVLGASCGRADWIRLNLSA